MSYSYSMENELYSFTFCRDDWERIISALRATSVTNLEEAHKAGLESVCGALCIQEAGYFSALADEIDFILPE